MFKKMRFSNRDCNPHKELFKLCGEYRYEAILELTSRERSFICGFYKQCDECPLALYHQDGNGLCSEFATELAVKTAINYGAKFVGEEDRK